MSGMAALVKNDFHDSDVTRFHLDFTVAAARHAE
jgi:hypothetical protein